MTFKEWGEKIQANFEEHFWINSTPMPDREPHPELIHKRGIYKDSYLAKPFYADFQLRPNFFVAMSVVSFEKQKYENSSLNNNLIIFILNNLTYTS